MSSISVIVCVRNQKYELRKTLQNLDGQTLTPSEIVIVDESESEEIYDFVKSQLNERVKYLRTGGSDGKTFSEKQLFEIGAKQASGDWLAFALPDDEWNPQKIQLISAAIDSDHDLDLIVHSFRRRVRFADEVFSADALSSNFEALFHFWSGISSAVIKKNLFLSIDELSKDDVLGLKVEKKSDFLCAIVFQPKKDLAEVQNSFWNENYGQIKKKDCVREAALYCIKTFQRADVSRNSFSDFARIVGLAPEDAPLVLFDKVAFDAQPSVVARKNQNYLLMRSWLELLISGGSVSSELRKRGVCSVIIYGAGRHGTILYNELKKSDVGVLAWIDKNAKDGMYLGLPVYNFENISKLSKSADAVIVTPFMDFDQIANDLAQFGFCNAISLMEIVS